MTDKPFFSSNRHALHVGVRFMHGFHAAHGLARAAERMPGVGPVAGLVVRAAGGVASAIEGYKNFEG